MIAATQVAAAKIRVVVVPILAVAMARAAATSVAAIAATADATAVPVVLLRSRKLLLLLQPKLRLMKKPLRSHQLLLLIRVLGLLSPARWLAPASFAKQLAIS
jgi:hypothetical protein